MNAKKASDATDTILVAGIPRSGSTWVASVLAAAPDACLISEPDNSYARPYALQAKLGLGSYPRLSKDAVHDPLAHLWREAVDRSGSLQRSFTLAIRDHLATRLFQSLSDVELRRLMDYGVDASLRARLAMALSVPARPSAPRVVIKTVYGSFALEWIAKQTSAAIILLQRHPMAIIASRLRMNWTRGGDGWLIPRDVALHLVDPHVVVPTDDDDLPPLEWIAWNICTISAQHASLAFTHPGWYSVDHEELCVDPQARFHATADEVGWSWHPAIEYFIEQSDRRGQGYKTNRLTSEAVGMWRQELDSQQIECMAGVQKQFPLLRRWL